ncbi:hypothetical protein FPZ54_07930 [Sphingomonas suaedae]|uniref:Translation initiation factor 2 n=1 Tax=Sphingomonas suaedae TaxID=2599297 RepID=A0A518REU5_9SPHN|nr:RebB family R body protein [Sphingomonas suaedae]QDX25958.1 hypothetical protein FPZ54_07930 [Sphingomonas suaedae]
MPDQPPEQPDDDAPGPEPADGGASGTVNSQITDAVTALNVLAAGGAPASAAAMLGLVAANTIGLGMHNAVTRQQADAAIASASITAACARMLGASLAPGVAPMTPSALVAAAEAQAQAAIALLQAQKEADGAIADEATAALARIAAAASAASPAPSPSPEKGAAPKAKAGKAQ